MRARAKDGAAVGAHLAAAARRGHAGAAELLEGPEIPEALADLAEWSRELARQRQYHMSGPQPLTYQEVEAWARLTDRQPAPHEVRALMLLDLVWAHPEPEEEDARGS
jgi:hypothetical protein